MASLMALAACQPKAEKVAAIDPTDMDLTVAPGEDFYKYANGGWQVKHPLTAEYARYGSFDALREDNVTRINDLFSEMSEMTPEAGSVEQKIVDLYKQGLDSVRLNEEGAAPLKKYLDQIYAVKDKKEFVALLAELNKMGLGGLFGIGVGADMMDGDKQIVYASQTSLGMGSRDYYLDSENAQLKQGYLEMLTKLFALSGNENPEQAAANVLKVEDELAAYCWTKAQLRDVEKQYNPMSYKEFAAKYPAFDFLTFGELFGIGCPEKICVEQLSYFDSFNKWYAKADLDVLKDYTAADIITSAAEYLSDEFYATDFDFFSRQMRGVTEHKPRWKRAMSVPNGILGEAVGKMYCEKYFPESSKNKALEIVNNLKESLGQHIDSLDWMSAETKAYAREKLANFTVKIGYPDKWKDYSTLAIDQEKSYFDNIIEARKWSVAENLEDLKKPTDRTKWLMSPQTVNAYYMPTTNEICFPAAILQPPFFNADADDAVNYGAIGVVIGHEMTHGFDDQGRLFDKNGNMNNWWSEADAEAFKAKTAILVDQFDKIEVLPGVFANGTFSLGENIADQGGVGVAYTAMQNSWNGVHPADIDGFTAEQRFFIGFAHVWAGNITEEEMARLTKVDEHSLSVNRVNATLKNFQIFFDAFGIKEGDAMWRPENERVMIW